MVSLLRDFEHKDTKAQRPVCLYVLFQERPLWLEGQNTRKKCLEAGTTRAVVDQWATELPSAPGKPSGFQQIKEN